MPCSTTTRKPKLVTFWGSKMSSLPSPCLNDLIPFEAAAPYLTPVERDMMQTSLGENSQAAAHSLTLPPKMDAFSLALNTNTFAAVMDLSHRFGVFAFFHFWPPHDMKVPGQGSDLSRRLDLSCS